MEKIPVEYTENGAVEHGFVTYANNRVVLFWEDGATQAMSLGNLRAISARMSGLAREAYRVLHTRDLIPK